MNRRMFLKYLGAAATIAAVPDLALGRRVAEAPLVWDFTPTALLECEPLEAGRRYTFTASTLRGLLITHIDAGGGETAIRVPFDAGADGHLDGPILSSEPLAVYFPRRMNNEELVALTLIEDGAILPEGAARFVPRENLIKEKP